MKHSRSIIAQCLIDYFDIYFIQTSFKASLLFALLFSFSISAEYYRDAKVLKVVDGDTVYVKYAEQTLKLRLLNIDAPELSQPYGNKSQFYLKSLIDSELIDIETTGQDRYKRFLTTIYFEGNNINKLMVERGLAWVYDDYVIDKTLYQHQRSAIKNKL